MEVKIQFSLRLRSHFYFPSFLLLGKHFMVPISWINKPNSLSLSLSVCLGRPMLARPAEDWIGGQKERSDWHPSSSWHNSWILFVSWPSMYVSFAGFATRCLEGSKNKFLLQICHFRCYEWWTFSLLKNILRCLHCFHDWKRADLFLKEWWSQFPENGQPRG